MKINTKHPNPGAWFDYPGDPDKARMKLRVVPGSVARDIARVTRGEKRVEYRDGQRFESWPEPDFRQEELLFWDYCIQDFSGFVGADDAPLEKTAENKVLLALQVVETSIFIRHCLQRLNADQKAFLEGLEKNFLTS